jgi:hypothetical protein
LGQSVLTENVTDGRRSARSRGRLRAAWRLSGWEIEGKRRGDRGHFIEANGVGFDYRNHRESDRREISARTRSSRVFRLEVDDDDVA